MAKIHISGSPEKKTKTKTKTNTETKIQGLRPTFRQGYKQLALRKGSAHFRLRMLSQVGHTPSWPASF